MTLDEYLNSLGRGSAAKLAEAIGAKPPYITRWRKGTQRPSPKFAKKIEEATFKMVTKEELRPDIYG